MIRTVLIDLSGTLHVENQAIPGAINALNKLLTSMHIRAENAIYQFVDYSPQI